MMLASSRRRRHRKALTLYTLKDVQAHIVLLGTIAAENVTPSRAHDKHSTRMQCWHPRLPRWAQKLLHLTQLFGLLMVMVASK